MEKLMETFAYISVALDFLVAVATYLVLQGAADSASLLVLSGDLMLIEVGLTAVIIIALLAVKHYKNVAKGLQMAAFKNKYRIPHMIKRNDALLTKIRKTFGNIVILILNISQKILY